MQQVGALNQACRVSRRRFQVKWIVAISLIVHLNQDSLLIQVAHLIPHGLQFLRMKHRGVH